MITNEQADNFAKQWIHDWNSHDIDAIVNHYADNIEFHSPIITSLRFNETGKITNKTDLKSYFNKGLDAYPDLKFNLNEVLVGTNSIVIYYDSVNGRRAAEVFELNELGQAIKVMCNYSLPIK